MDILFASDRLLFREFTAEDVQLIHNLNKDPEVTKYVHEPAITYELATDVLNHIIIPQYNKYHHGRWAVHLKNSLEFVGWCGLKQTDQHPFPDLGYRFHQKFWGNGFATEAAKRTIEYGFMVLELPGIYATAHVENKASIHVLEKCGLQFKTTKIIDGIPVKTFELLNNLV